jgi:hypothetical protein
MRIKTGMKMASLVLMLLVGNVFGQDDDRADILALMERAFAAVSSGSAEEWRAIQLADRFPSATASLSR